MRHVILTRALALLSVLMACGPAAAENTVVLGRLVANEPMDYVKDECPENHICLRSWWKSVVEVQKTIHGAAVSDRVTAANMQHTSLSPRFRQAVRLFVLEAIEDPDQRAKLRADYYLEDMSEPHQMFCLSDDPKVLGLKTGDTYIEGTGDDKVYCFELPGG